MKITEAREAFIDAIEDIKKTLANNGLTAESKCYTADHDLSVVDDGDTLNAALIAAEISVSAAGTEEKMLLESAISITDGEVSSDELRNEISILRGTAGEICEKIKETGDAKEAFKSFELPEEELPESPKYDNKKFYIGGAIAVAVILILIIIFK